MSVAELRQLTAKPMTSGKSASSKVAETRSPSRRDLIKLSGAGALAASALSSASAGTNA
jgi:hypothetical protein